jgi:NO-binding membrane sensor protein with MHYT domain
MGAMGATSETGFGWITPVLAYAMATVGAGLGLRCAVRALTYWGRSKLYWLLTAAVSLGTGIWTMHFIAMLGFTVAGTQIRYDVDLTVLSLAVSILVTALGILLVGYGRSRAPSLALGGLLTGTGVAAMHYLGMAAVRLSGTVVYDKRTVALSVAIAVGAATAALWAGLAVRGPAAAAGAALLMGIAVTAMHYTGMSAATVRLDDAAGAAGLTDGVGAMDFLLPMIVCLGSGIFLTSAFVALSPTASPIPEPAGPAAARSLDEDERGTRV